MRHTPRAPVPPRMRMESYRQRMRAAGFKPVQIWVPDTKSPSFAEKCRQQVNAVAAADPAGEEILRMIEQLRDWPEA